MSNFIPHLDLHDCRFLNLRMHLLSEPCVHCDRRDNLKAHGFLKAADGSIRGIRLYCSDRRSLHGCGRTFSIHFEDRMPQATLGAAQVGAILEAVHGKEETNAEGSDVPPPTLKEVISGVCSRSTAYRWIDRFRQNQWLTLRPLIFWAIERDWNVTGSVEIVAWRHLRAALGTADRVIRNLQRCFQTAPFLKSRKDVRPKYHRAVSARIGLVVMATGIETDPLPRCGYFRGGSVQLAWHPG